MRAKEILSVVPVPSHIVKHVYSRVTLSKFTIIYFSLALIHLLVLGGFQLGSHITNHGADHTLSTIIAAGSTESKLIPIVVSNGDNGEIVKLCNGIPQDPNDENVCKTVVEVIPQPEEATSDDDDDDEEDGPEATGRVSRPPAQNVVAPTGSEEALTDSDASVSTTSAAVVPTEAADDDEDDEDADAIEDDEDADDVVAPVNSTAIASPSVPVVAPTAIIEVPADVPPAPEAPVVDLPAPLPDVPNPLPEVVPELPVPEVEIPVGQPGEVVIPPVDLPPVEVPGLPLPPVDLPPVDLPDIPLPEIPVPELPIPELPLPEVQLPEIPLPVPEIPLPVPEIELPEVELPELPLPEIDIPVVGPIGGDAPEQTPDSPVEEPSPSAPAAPEESQAPIVDLPSLEDVVSIGVPSESEEVPEAPEAPEAPEESEDDGLLDIGLLGRRLVSRKVPAPVKRALSAVATNGANGQVSGVEITDLQNNGSTEKVNISLICAQVINLPYETVHLAQKEDLVLLGFYVYIFGLAFVAIVNESIHHLVAAFLSSMLGVAWSAYQVIRTNSFRQEFQRLVTQGSCNGTELLPAYWRQRNQLEIPGLILNSLFTIALGAVAFKLISTYRNRTSEVTGGQNFVKRLYKTMLILSIVIQVTSFLLIASIALWIDQLFEGIIASFSTSTPMYKGISLAALFLTLPWLIIGWVSVRKERKILMIIFFVLTTLFLVAWCSIFASDTFKLLFVKWSFFAAVSVSSFGLLVISLLVAVVCRMHFGQGLASRLDESKKPEEEKMPWDFSSSTEKAWETFDANVAPQDVRGPSPARAQMRPGFAF